MATKPALIRRTEVKRASSVTSSPMAEACRLLPRSPARTSTTSAPPSQRSTPSWCEHLEARGDRRIYALIKAMTSTTSIVRFGRAEFDRTFDEEVRQLEAADEDERGAGSSSEPMRGTTAFAACSFVGNAKVQTTWLSFILPAP